jgi:RHS repeat-associated protein
LTYAYDPAGNRVRTGGSWARTLLPAAVSGGTYDAANRQLTLGPKTMTYDLNGNLATLREAGQTTTYTWDARDRLVGLSAPGLSASFAYDAARRRTQKTINAFATDFQYDELDTIKEIAGGGTVNYLRAPGIDEHLARIEDTGATFCYAPDALGSTLALTDVGGTVSTEYSYEPFGRTTTNGAVSQNAFQFTGRENDGTGLYYYRARWYSPTVGRFLQEDPLGPGGGVDLYPYVGNDPIGGTDPLGLKRIPPPVYWPPNQNPGVPGQSWGKDPSGVLRGTDENLRERLGQGALRVFELKVWELAESVDCGKPFNFWLCFKRPVPGAPGDLNSIEGIAADEIWPWNNRTTECRAFTARGTRGCNRCPPDPGPVTPRQAPR